MEYARIRNFINNQWVEESGVDCAPLFNPSTGEQIGEVPLSRPETSKAAVDAAHAAYPAWSSLSVGKRVAYLFAIRQAMADRREELAQAIAIDQAKHISEARGEVQRVVEIIETACSIPTLIQGETLDHISGNVVGRISDSLWAYFAGGPPSFRLVLVVRAFRHLGGQYFVFKPSPISLLHAEDGQDIPRTWASPRAWSTIIHGSRNVSSRGTRIQGQGTAGRFHATAKQMARPAAGAQALMLGGAKNYWW